MASECLAPCPQGRGFKAWITLQRFSLCAFSHSERFGRGRWSATSSRPMCSSSIAAPSCSERRHRGLEQRENANGTLTTVTLHLRSEGVTGKRRFPGRGPDDRRGLEPPLRTSDPRRLRTNRGGRSKPEIPVETGCNQRSVPQRPALEDAREDHGWVDARPARRRSQTRGYRWLLRRLAQLTLGIRAGERPVIATPGLEFVASTRPAARPSAVAPRKIQCGAQRAGIRSYAVIRCEVS